MEKKKETIAEDLMGIARKYFAKDFTMQMACTYSVLDSYEFGFSRGVLEAIKFMNKGEDNGKRNRDV